MQTFPQTASFSMSDVVRKQALAKLEAERRRNPVRLAEAGPREYDRCVDRMADDMRDIAGACGACLADDLLLRGWKAEDILMFGEAANRKAVGCATRAAQ